MNNTDLFQFNSPSAHIGIIYTEFEPDTYQCVEFRYYSKDLHIDQQFASGDVVADFRQAIKYCIELGLGAFYSSSVDNFVMDDERYGYAYDEELNANVIIRMEE